MEVLAALSDKSVEDKYVASEFTAIKDTVLEQQTATFRDLFTMDEDRHFHRVALAYINQVFQQISGINLIIRDSKNSFWNLLIDCLHGNNGGTCLLLLN